MTRFNTAAQFTTLTDYRRDLVKSLAKARGITALFYCRRFKFGGKTGPLLVVAPVEKALAQTLRKEHAAKEGRCVRQSDGSFEIMGKLTREEFDAALEFAGIEAGEIPDESGDDTTATEIAEKRVDRGLRSVGDEVLDRDESVGEDIADLFASEEDVRAEVAQEEQLFARFDRDFDSFETMSQSLQPAERKALDKAMQRMLKRAEQKHRELFGSRRELSAGDLDELIQVFSHIPRGLVPPRFKKELQDWRNTRDAMREMAVVELMREAEPEAVENVRSVLEAITTPTGVVTTAGELIGGEKFEAVKQVIERASGALETINASIGALQKGKERLSGEQKTALERRMASSEVRESLTELADAAMELGGDFVPVIGTINNAKNVVLNGAATLTRIDRALGDGILRDIAIRDTASQLSRALGQSCSREKRLAAEAGVKTVTSTLGVASDLSVAADAGTLKIVNGVLKVGSKAVFNVADALTDTAAARTLQRARAGDEQAQQEVFGRHAHYAKFLLAAAARRGDRLATMYFADRGLTEADIAENSTEILMKFGLQESKETEAPVATTDKIRAKLEKLSDNAGRVLNALKSGIQTARQLIFGTRAEEPAPQQPSAAKLGQWFTVEALRQMSETLTRARAQRDAMRGATPPEWLTHNIANLEDALEKASGPLHAYMGVLQDELAAQAAEPVRVAAIRAQLEPVHEALRYLADAGFLR
jgi:hypothetical protein